MGVIFIIKLCLVITITHILICFGESDIHHILIKDAVIIANHVV